jgi:hypothetical protein
MANFKTWTVLPHKPVVKATENLWHVEGKLGAAHRVMCVARYDDGSLLVHNGIALEEPAMKELEAWGKPSILVVPAGSHRQDAFIWKQRYPEMRVVCPRGAQRRVEAAVHVDGHYDSLPADPRVVLEYVDGTKEKEGVLRVTSSDGKTAVFTDLIMNQPKIGGVWGFALAPTGRISVPRLARLGLISDKKAFAAHIRRIADDNLVRLIVAHGASVHHHAGEKLKEALETL